MRTEANNGAASNAALPIHHCLRDRATGTSMRELRSLADHL